MLFIRSSFTMLLPLLSLLVACSSDQRPLSTPTASVESQPSNSLSDAPAKQATPITPPPSAPNTSPLTPSGTASKTIYQLLQGKWQSTQDAQSFIELKGHLYIDSYADEPLDTTDFLLSSTCPSDPGAGQPGNNERYLVQPQENMCWEIVLVDEESLELSYTARGNSLIYRKVK